ncbi:MAG: hypothetical protein WA324_08555 [Bryobacteraceae bacterium]
MPYLSQLLSVEDLTEASRLNPTCAPLSVDSFSVIDFAPIAALFANRLEDEYPYIKAADTAATYLLALTHVERALRLKAERTK